ncbi:uncharacterized protein B0H18DRAFT_1001181 [Fomitopsis serialis]|uniref:uncharacterized protein n=1 Tax=Fomitopsis serialis TaxID=139415 RepID=UPI0020085289|nr:uncharacterized protein B0H18DRAFT_1001181 [Neoantrodia serialis]KAH9928412.1 hypothetical protein B0H18DRAFT_1001181 [Neoantrodia serialis]
MRTCRCMLTVRLSTLAVVQADIVEYGIHGVREEVDVACRFVDVHYHVQTSRLKGNAYCLLEPPSEIQRVKIPSIMP